MTREFRSSMLCSLAVVMALAAAPARAEVISTLQTGAIGTFAVSASDLADASQGATTSFSGTALLGSVDKVHDGGVYGGLASNNSTNTLTPTVGSMLIFNLDTVSSPLGFDIASISVLTGVGSTQLGRSDHAYTIALKPIDGVFSDLITVSSTTTGYEVKSTISDNGGALLGTGIEAVKFTFANATSNAENMYREIDVFGTATVVVPEPATLGLLLGALCGLASYGWRRRK